MGGAKALDVMVVRPHKLSSEKVSNTGPTTVNTSKPNLSQTQLPSCPESQLLPLTPSRSSPAVSSRCLSESSSSPEQSPLKSSFGSPSEKSSEKGRSSVTIPETSANKWAPHSSSESHSQNPSPSQTSCAN